MCFKKKNLQKYDCISINDYSELNQERVTQSLLYMQNLDHEINSPDSAGSLANFWQHLQRASLYALWARFSKQLLPLSASGVLRSFECMAQSVTCKLLGDEHFLDIWPLFRCLHMRLRSSFENLAYLKPPSATSPCPVLASAHKGAKAGVFQKNDLCDPWLFDGYEQLIGCSSIRLIVPAGPPTKIDPCYSQTCLGERWREQTRRWIHRLGEYMV